jgi:NodT family efflux transporter outer membrane factor (OMF) lipoprotein
VRRRVSSRALACRPATALIVFLTLAGCTVGPDYSRDAAPTPTEFKELKGWKHAEPRDDSVARGDWWRVYRDRGLDELLPQVEISNQTVAANAAAYEEAKAVIRQAQAALFPTATAEYTVTRTRTGPAALGSGGVSGSSVVAAAGGKAVYATQYTAPISGSWDLDVWGKIRRQIESNTAAAQASAADLDNAKLSAQAQLATAYFNLRAADSLRDLLERTVVQFKETLRVTRNKVNAGCCSGPGLTAVSPADLALAAAQVENTEAQAINVGVTRAQFEHAIAMLIGRPPAELTLGPRLLSGGIPKIPVTMPSLLLERRPDIAASERTMQQQNALIGVAEAAYFPDISLSSMLEFIGPIPLPFSAARSIGSIGAAGTQTLFNGGLTAAQVDAARAVYWESVANYRQTVLTAFQQVEDELAAIRILSRQLGLQQAAVRDAREAVRVFSNQYQAGTVDLTTVVTAETTMLADEETELTVRQDLFLASVSLIEALGGGWDTLQVPTQVQLQKDFSLLQKLEPAPPVVESAPADAAVAIPASAPQGPK